MGGLGPNKKSVEGSFLILVGGTTKYRKYNMFI